jgi:hypothetical protein
MARDACMRAAASRPASATPAYAPVTAPSAGPGPQMGSESGSPRRVAHLYMVRQRGHLHARRLTATGSASWRSSLARVQDGPGSSLTGHRQPSQPSTPQVPEESATRLDLEPRLRRRPSLKQAPRRPALTRRRQQERSRRPCNPPARWHLGLLQGRLTLGEW